MDSVDLELFERGLRHAAEHLTGEALDAALLELGWHDALAADPRAAVSILFEVQGSANVTSSALDSVVLGALGLEGAIVLPALGRWDPPGELHADRVCVHGVGTRALATQEAAFVMARIGDKDVAFDLPTAGLTLRPVHGVDPWLGLIEVTGNTSRQHCTTGGRWEAAVAAGRLAVAHELVGAAKTMLALAREHALERVQFGQPIATFQAVRHRLADTLVAIETADAVLAAAWDDHSPETAAMAKALAGRGARTAARHSQQVLAGIGFTTEHVFHRYLRRVLVLDELLGSARSLTRELGTDLLKTRQLPPLLPL
jgi:hypothetical protein